MKGKNKGITLIALVITIIVLLILAGISIALLTGENGILEQAKKAAEATKQAKEQEELDLEELNNQIEIAKNGGEFKIEDIGIGWTLGNSLDSYNGEKLGVTETETLWGNPVTTKEMISEIKKGGYTTLLVPVTWYKHIDSNGIIEEAWLNRVQEVVSYALDNNMYVILNTHHDDKKIDLNLATAEFNATIQKYKSIWKQIAEKFKDTDGRLIFEVLNEPRVIQNGENIWSPSTDVPYQNLNTFNREMLETIRGVGAKNTNRWVLIPTYGTLITTTALDKIEIPQDKHVAVSAHGYITYEFCNSTTVAYTNAIQEEIHYKMKLLSEFTKNKKVPTLMTETGCFQKEDRNEWIKDLWYEAGKNSIPLILWDDGKSPDGYAIFDRNQLKFIDTTAISTMKQYYDYGKNWRTAKNAIEGINTTQNVSYTTNDGMGARNQNGKNYYYMNMTPTTTTRIKFTDSYQVSDCGIYQFSCKIKTNMSDLGLKMVLNFYDENDNLLYQANYIDITEQIDGSQSVYEYTKTFRVKNAKKVILERISTSSSMTGKPVEFELYDISLTNL